MMKAGQEMKMMPGAVAACFLPVGLGLLFTVFLLSSGSAADLFMTLPISLCFVFGTPLSAWLACRRLRKIDDANRLSRWGTSFWAGLLWSSVVHFAAAFIYTVGFMFWAARDAAINEVPIGEDLFSIFFMSAFINLMLWGVLTLPFALISASVFWRVSKFPKDVSVF